VTNKNFSIDTISQYVDVDNSEEFLSFLKSTSEQILDIRISLNISLKSGFEGNASTFTNNDFVLASSKDGIEIEFAQAVISKYLDLLHKFEEVLQLVPYRLVLSEQLQQIRQRTAFIAHVFDNAGNSYAFQLTQFLNLLGFETITGKGYSPEKISSKVRRRLLAQEIVIVVVSKKDDFTWLIQEATGADFAKKPIFLLVQEDINFSKGMLADLEYISFPVERISETFTSILEGLRELGFRFA